MSAKPEVQIDWSKAPAKATHCHAPSGEWVRVEGSRVSVWHPSVGLWHTSVVEQARLTEDEGFYRRPVRWNGKGLPPVGTICQFVSDMEDGSDWYPGLKSGATVEVVAHFHTGLADVAAFVFDNLDSRQVEQARAECFRPFKTAEQIAVEERKEQIDQILADAGVTGSAFDGDPEAEVWAAALLDAGYRKVEGGAQ